MELSGNTILITGGGSGIGLAFAKALSNTPSNTLGKEKKNRVIIFGRDKAKLKDAKEKGYAADYLVGNLAQEEDQAKLEKYIATNYPELNLLINNAGIQRNYKFNDAASHLSLIEEEININFTGQVKLTDRLLPILLKQNQALVVNLTSALAVVPKESAAVYCATKAALRSFSTVLRYQLEGNSVKVIEVVPALVDTAMTAGRGRGKISPEQLVKEALAGMRSGKEEIRIGKTKLLFLLNRIWPSLASRIIRKN